MSRTKWAVGQRVLLTQHDETFAGAVGTVTSTAADVHYLIVKLDTPVATGRIERNRMVYEATWAVSKKSLQVIDTCKDCGGRGATYETVHTVTAAGPDTDTIPHVCDTCKGHGHTGGPVAAAIAAYYEGVNESRAEARNEAALYGPW